MVNFTQQLEEPLSQKQKTFFLFLHEFQKCALNLKNFENKDQYRNLVIPKVIDWEKGCYLTV